MAQPVVSITNFTKLFGQQKAVDNLSLEVFPGDVFAFLGSNGSGKTTTFRCLLGIYQADKGELLVNGQVYTSEMNSQVGYLPEERGLYTKTKVRDVFNYIADLRGIDKKTAKKRIDDYLERVDLVQHQTKKISQLSSGMQQKVQIGVTIIHRPPILLLDEPFKGLDPVNRQLFLDMFEELREEGTTIMYSTHNVDEVQRIANRLVMIKKGKRVLYGTVAEVRAGQGTKNLLVSYDGKLPANEKLYTSRIEHNYAELAPVAGVDPDTIIRFLLDADLEIKEFKVDEPSLNEIFIKTAKEEDK